MMTTPNPPEWLTKRDGSLTPGVRDRMFYMLVGKAPQYTLEVRPAAAGKFLCAVQQSVNGKRLDNATTYDTPETAFAGGLEQLRTNLGW